MNTQETIRQDVFETQSTASSLFEPVGFFMLRTPLLPIEKFHDLNVSGEEIVNQLKCLSQTGIIQESVALASPSLFTALSNLFGPLNDRKTKQVASGLLRYLLRMSTRPTPFGLFSGVAVGTLTENTDIHLNSRDTYLKRTRPDMEWLLALVRELEQRREIVRQVRVQRNHAAFQIGERMMLPYVTACGQVNRETNVITDHVSIRATEPALMALKMAERHVPFNVLVQQVSEQYPKVDREKVEGLVWQLFCQEFLISELRPPLTLDNPLGYILRHLSDIPGAETEYKALLEIENLINRYDELDLGKGLDAHQTLVNRMKKIHGMDKPLQVDLALSTTNSSMHKRVGEEIARAAECLWKLSIPQHGFGHLRQYHRRFLERYGTAREVPVLDVLSEEIGLGAPATYKFPPSREQEPVQPKPTRQREEILTNLLLQAVWQHKDEVEITEELLDSLVEGELDPRNAPQSLEIFAEVVSRSAECIDHDDFLLVIGPNPGSQSAGQSFGRFLDLLGDSASQRMNDLYERLEHENPGPVYLEVSYLPNSGHSANVALTPMMRNYELAIGTNPSGQDGTQVLTLDDLLVGATLDRLYLKSGSLDKEIVVTSGHMLNYTNAPNVYRFLRELSMEGVRNWNPFTWGALESSPYLPRVRYGKTILSPAVWRLTPGFLGLNDNSNNDVNSDIVWDRSLRNWRRSWEVPRYVFMTHTDNRLLLDLDNPDHVSELRKELFRTKGISLREMVGGFENQWIDGADGHYIMECVFPLKKRTGVGQPNSPVRTSRANVLSETSRVRLPGSDWMFFKLYGADNRVDELIAQWILPFSENVIQQGIADNWFYIRYLDPEPHIRLRFHGDAKCMAALLLPRASDWANILIKHGLIQRIIVDTYEREIERYGGPKLISTAEKVFGVDSITSGQLLNLIRLKQVDCSKEVLSAISITILMTQFGWGFEKQLNWLEDVVDKHENSQEFRQIKRQLLGWAGPSGSWDGLRSARNGDLILEAVDKRQRLLQHMGVEIGEVSAIGELWNTPEMIVGSLIHMHCNRLMGVDRNMERKALSFARHTLVALDHMNKAHAW